jgi:hypothetical protein
MSTPRPALLDDTAGMAADAIRREIVAHIRRVERYAQHASGPVRDALDRYAASGLAALVAIGRDTQRGWQ